MSVCTYSVFVLCCVVLCVGRGLATGLFLVQRVLPFMDTIKEFRDLYSSPSITRIMMPAGWRSIR
jgi:hypothetical protein